MALSGPQQVGFIRCLGMGGYGSEVVEIRVLSRIAEDIAPGGGEAHFLHHLAGNLPMADVTIRAGLCLLREVLSRGRV